MRPIKINGTVQAILKNEMFWKIIGFKLPDEINKFKTNAK